jgi:UDP-glucose-4-epimerase GalE
LKNILVVGGAGYIGSHTCKCLHENGYAPIVLDNLVTGHREAVKWGPLIEGALDDKPLLDQVFSNHDISAVMHFAAFAYVGESVGAPLKYYRNNTAGTLALLEAMMAHGVLKFVFSSTCAIFGEPVGDILDEAHPKNPINPYGRTKLMVERMLEDFHGAYGLQSVRLRYFNAAGADPGGEIGEDHEPETHLIPLVLKTALQQREAVEIYGDDYPTRDGTCIRDYIHTSDLARAHLQALEILLGGEPGGAYNLGTGTGYSVREVVETARRVTGRHIPVIVKGRRPGDPARLVAASEKAKKELGWQPEHGTLGQIIQTAWDWIRENPGGYGE